MVESRRYFLGLVRGAMVMAVGAALVLTWAGCSDDSPGPDVDAGLDGGADSGGGGGDGGQDAQAVDAAVLVEHHSTIAAAGALPLDLLFVLDNSNSMLNEQQQLRQQFPVLVDRLRHMPGGLPDIHVGVVSTDLGAGPYTNLGGCETVGGDQGQLGFVGGTNLGETAIGSGQHYIVDVEPQGCNIDKVALADGVQCQSHDCTQENCDQAATGSESLTLVTDSETGCPRCRNYEGDISDVFSSYADFGITGCGFEQQLESARLALDSSNESNIGFLRDGAVLAVVWVTDEDDCSASDPQTLFNPDPNLDNINSALGPLSSFRCFEFGITCDVNDRTVAGPRHNCVPRDDAGALLHPVSRYTAFFEALKDPEWFLAAAIAGPVGDTVNVSLDNLSRPKVDFSCMDAVNSNEGGTPAIRIQAVVGAFNTPDAMDSWAFSSVCSTDYTPVLNGVAAKAAGVFGGVCIDAPLHGCPAGPSGSRCMDCIPSCKVYELADRGTDQEKRYEIPWCGRICTDGLCQVSDLLQCDDDGSGRCICPSGNSPTEVDGQKGCAVLHYPDGVPNVSGHDEALENLVPAFEPSCQGTDCTENQAGQVSACWYVTANSACNSNLAVKVIRAQDPESAHVLDFTCRINEPTESNCGNGIDDDQDCETDEDDPDCAQD